MGLLPSPQPQAVKEGFQWRPTRRHLLFQLGLILCAVLCFGFLLATYLKEAFTTCWQELITELHSRVSWIRIQRKKARYGGSFHSADLHTSPLRTRGFNLVPGCLIGGYSSGTEPIKWRGSLFHTEGLLHRGSLADCGWADSTARPARTQVLTLPLLSYWVSVFFVRKMQMTIIILITLAYMQPSFTKTKMSWQRASLS